MALTELGFLFLDNPNPMWIFELSTLRILKVNKAAIHRYGYSEQEFLSMTTLDLRPAAEVAAYIEFLNKSSLTDPAFKGIAHSGVWKHKNKAGSSLYAEIVSQDIVYNDVNCRIVVAGDVTEKIKYREVVDLREQELLGTKNSLEALINNTEDQIWSVDLETRYVYLNKAYRETVAQLTGFEPKEGDHANRFVGFNAAITARWDEFYKRALNGENYTIINESVDPQNGQLHSFEISFNPIFKSKGEIAGVGCFARDITERLKTERAIVDQNERLRHIASVTSHELRRPVASMLGLINIMDRDNFFNPDNKEIIEHLLTVGNEIDEVIRLIVDKTFTDDPSTKYQAP